MKKKEPRRSFTREFKLEAVRQVVEGHRPVAEVARELDINASMLSFWKRLLLAEGGEAFPGKGRLRPQDEEFRRLEREVKRLKMENEFLKRATAYFAKEGSRGTP